MPQLIQTYSDLPFFITKKPFTNDFNLVKDLNAIRQSIKNLLMTNNGERSFDFLFGGNMESSLFETLNTELILSIQEKIGRSIQSYESRVELNDIKILNYPKENKIDILVDFYVPALNIKDVISISILRTR